MNNFLIQNQIEDYLQTEEFAQFWWHNEKQKFKEEIYDLMRLDG